MHVPTNIATLPLTTVSVVSHGDGVALLCLLESLAKYEQAGHIQLIVTDNLGRDLPQLPAGTWQSLVMLRNERPQGYGSNHDVAFRLARGQYFCVVNPDVVFVESILSALVADLQEKAADIAAPLIEDSLGRIQDSFRRLPSPWEIVRRRVGASGLAPQIPQGDRIHPEWIAGMFLLMSRQTFADLRGFDERYRLYFEDVDLCTRARLSGRSIMINPQLRLQHDPRRASRRDLRYLLWHVQSAARFFSSDVYRRARQLRGKPAPMSIK